MRLGWLWHFTRTKCNDEHAMLGVIARSLDLRDRSKKHPSDQYWYQVVRGHYFTVGGDVRAFKRYVAEFRSYARRQEEEGAIPFLETHNYRLIHDYIESRRARDAVCRFGGIEGETGSQKTVCEKHYTQINNHCETVHIEAPARCTRSRFVHKLGECIKVNAGWGIAKKEIEIERWARGGSSGRARTIIVGNVQRLFRPNVEPDQQPIFNYLHELQDDTGCCVIFEWVPSFRKTITASDPFWAQFLGRIGGPDEILRVDQKLPRSDLLAFARAFAVADDAGALAYLKAWGGTQWGVRVLMHKLKKARLLATARRSKEVLVEHLKGIDLEPLPADVIADGEEDGES